MYQGTSCAGACETAGETYKHTNILDLLVKLFPMHRHIVKKPEKHLAALGPAGAPWDILALLDIYPGI